MVSMAAFSANSPGETPGNNLHWQLLTWHIKLYSLKGITAPLWTANTKCVHCCPGMSFKGRSYLNAGLLQQRRLFCLLELKSHTEKLPHSPNSLLFSAHRFQDPVWSDLKGQRHTSAVTAAISCPWDVSMAALLWAMWNSAFPLARQQRHHHSWAPAPHQTALKGAKEQHMWKRISQDLFHN